MRRDHVASTLIRRHFDVMCLLGRSYLLFLWGRQPFWSSAVCFLVHQTASEKGSTLKGKNLLPSCGANSFFLEQTSFQMEKTHFDRVVSLESVSISLTTRFFFLYSMHCDSDRIDLQWLAASSTCDELLLASIVLLQNVSCITQQEC